MLVFPRVVCDFNHGLCPFWDLCPYQFKAGSPRCRSNKPQDQHVKEYIEKVEKNLSQK